MNASNSQLIFDFDGVIVNSVREVAITAHNAVASQQVFSLDSLPSGYLELFLSNRFYVQPAGDFLPFATWCLEQLEKSEPESLSVETFQKVLARDSRPLKERTSLFFENRKNFVSTNPEGWLSLHQVYQPLFDALQGGITKELVILTNKNREAVAKLLPHFGLDVVLEHVFSGDGGATKHENFLQIKTQHPADRYFFVDDSIYNLTELRESLPTDNSFIPLLATWGYVGPEDVSCAKVKDIQCVSQEELLALASQLSAKD